MKGKGYGIHNFHLPDDEMRRRALGAIAGTPYRTKHVLKVIPPFFEPINPPDEQDWLHNQEEMGQTFDTYLGQPHNVIDERRKRIYIVPLESSIPESFLERLRAYCQAFFFGVKIVKLKAIDVENKGVSCRTNNDKKQFNAKDVLKCLEKVLPKDAFCMIGVCMTDLFHKEEWNFIFGLASLKERVGVFSFARYDERFFSEENYELNFDLIFEEAAGVMVHEISHMFGLRHCVYHQCVMNGSNHLEESRSRPLEPCPVCIRKLQSNINFDLY